MIIAAIYQGVKKRNAKQKKLDFYSFDGSVWCSAPRLAIEELGLQQDYTLHTVNLAEGQNFHPEFLKFQPSGTLPIMKNAKGDSYTDTEAVVKQILSESDTVPKTSYSPQEIHNQVASFHQPAIDPNALFSHSADENQRERKSKGVVGAFFAGRQKALLKVTAAKPHDSFLKNKLAGNTQFLEFYQFKAPEEAVFTHYQNAALLWSNTGNFIRQEFEALLALVPGPYIGGQEIGEADYHAIAWLARAITAAGSWGSFEKLTDGVPPSVKQYYTSWSERPSFKKLAIV